MQCMGHALHGFLHGLKLRDGAGYDTELEPRRVQTLYLPGSDG